MAGLPSGGTFAENCSTCCVCGADRSLCSLNTGGACKGFSAVRGLGTMPLPGVEGGPLKGLTAPTGEVQMRGSRVAGRPDSGPLPKDPGSSFQVPGSCAFSPSSWVPATGTGVRRGLRRTAHGCRGTRRILMGWLGSQTEGGLHEESP